MLGHKACYAKQYYGDVYRHQGFCLYGKVYRQKLHWFERFVLR